MRDMIKDKEYFEDYIQRQKKRLTKFESWLEDESLKDRFDTFYSQIWSIKLNILYAMYSKGDNLEEVQNQFEDLIEDWKLLFDTQTHRPPHGKIMNMMSLFILFNEKQKAREIYDKYLTEEEKNDWILNFLLSDDISNLDNISGEIKFGKLYLPIQNLILDGNIENIKEYMQKKWYKAHNDFPWYDDHKSKVNVYCGYWAFLIGAIVKKLDLYDGSLKDVDYYPYDLVSFNK